MFLVFSCQTILFYFTVRHSDSSSVHHWQLHDAHTSYYRKPACLALATAVSPFVFDVALGDSKRTDGLPAVAEVRVRSAAVQR